MLLLLLATPGLDAAAPPEHLLPTGRSAGDSDGARIVEGQRGAIAGERGANRTPHDEGKRLFSEGRVDEALPFLEEQCRVNVDESACAAASGIYLSRLLWPEAFDVAATYERNACRQSDRLSAILLLKGTCELGREAGEGVVRLRPDHEMSYLILAAAHLRCGDPKSARELIQRALPRVRSRRLLERLLEGCRPSETGG